MKYNDLMEKNTRKFIKIRNVEEAGSCAFLIKMEATKSKQLLLPTNKSDVKAS